MNMNLPNALSLFRLILIPVMVILFYLPIEHSAVLTGSVFFIAGFTDLLDGYLARKLNQSSAFGAFIDPVADKVLVATALILIVEYYNSAWVTIPAALMIGREIIISALREWMAEAGKRDTVAVSWLGKVKTAAQMLAILLFLIQPNGILLYTAYVTFTIATILTIWSMCSYLYQARKELLKGI
ncbi:CDP-diacylglycerol--glycerol-3-phosphate 3-phosphatidyltransferase [Vibrio sp. RW]|uniref:CDP-diacylglycerol--glycerol-3-phosphate 3-phosphatidyltransferase n=1 Tax=Vibrio sp. RW TaxID=2998833 RepID=UPI0022CD642D|nr:CDP-diacylglycerol--glycerol-3-phosphate 3-phosphatidyltransferase [Vibrio sp. RW]MDA0143755.1 CDP-diacylglycerol--glycerol-3-phosphate 3-phosphatidyltransferase [Vibrio sp. RW]